MRRRTYFILFTVLAATVVCAGSGIKPTAVPAFQEPVVTKAIAPASYPAIAAQAHASGKVVIEVEVDAGGHVISAHAVDGHPLLQGVAVRTARRWEFAPAVDRVKPASVRITFDFQVVYKNEEQEIFFKAPYEFRYAVNPCTVINTSNQSSGK